jgi:hypothetical protein
VGAPNGFASAAMPDDGETTDDYIADVRNFYNSSYGRRVRNLMVPNQLRF